SRRSRRKALVEARSRRPGHAPFGRIGAEPDGVAAAEALAAEPRSQVDPLPFARRAATPRPLVPGAEARRRRHGRAPPRGRPRPSRARPGPLPGGGRARRGAPPRGGAAAPVGGRAVQIGAGPPAARPVAGGAEERDG